MRKIIILLLLGVAGQSFGQIMTKEDSLAAGISNISRPSVLSGYGEVKVSYDTRLKTGRANITRNVLFFGHRFSKNILFFSEMELENTKIAGGGSLGELSMEQLVLKLNINRDMYLLTGLFLPRIGMMNENHLPTTFNGNDRPFVETLLVPSTWREIGIGFYARSRRMPGMNYSLSLMNGLNAAGFSYGTGIRDGRSEGSFASASNIALHGSLLYYIRNFRLQLSGYYGGSSGITSHEADSLQLESGPFGNAVALGEFNMQYQDKGFTVKAMFAGISIPNAGDINRAYAKNTPSALYGAYCEVAYDLLHNRRPTESTRKLNLFTRVEKLDLNYKLPENGIADDLQKKLFWVTGLSYYPIPGIAFKLDYVYSKTGMYNKALYVTNPFDPLQPFYQTRGNINLGFAYSF